MKVLIIPSWYPTSENPVYGVFVEEYVRATALYDDVRVLYVYASDCINKPAFENSGTGGGEIETNYIKYPGMFNGGKYLCPEKNNGIPLKGIRKLKYLSALIAEHIIHSVLIWVGFYRILKTGWRPDIINVHVFSAGIMPIIIGKLYKIPVVVTEHYTGFMDCSLSKTEFWKAKFVLRKANLIMPVSRSLEKSIKQYGIICPSTVVPNILNTDVFHYSNRRDVCHVSCRIKKMLTVSSLIPHKAIEILITAVSIIAQERDNFLLDIVGDGPMREELERLVHNKEMDRFIKFHGSRPKKAVSEFMQNCDFFVLPSLKETFSVVTIEALACGKPVVASDISGPNEIITPDTGILFQPGDLNHMVAAITHMLDHYHEYDSETIARRAEERYNYSVVGRQIHDIYEKITIRQVSNPGLQVPIEK